MNEVFVKHKVFWRFKHNHDLQVTKDKKIINVKSQSLLKYHPRGFFINGKYYKRNNLNKMIEKIPVKEYYPF
jgi:hypothetical protein